MIYHSFLDKDWQFKQVFKLISSPFSEKKVSFVEIFDLSSNLRLMMVGKSHSSLDVWSNVQ